MDSRMKLALWALLHDREFVKQHHTLIDVEALPRGALRWLVAQALVVWAEHKSLLTRPVLVLQMEREQPERWGTTDDLIIDLYEEAWRGDYDAGSLGALRSAAAEWFRQQNIGRVVDETAEALEDTDIDAAERALRKASRAAAKPQSSGIELQDMLRARLERPAVPTGFVWFDAHWRGGLHHGQLGIIVAPSNGGKSMFLPYVTAAALRKGKGTAYYTTELSEDTVLKRVVAALSKTPINDLHDPMKMETAYAHVREVLDMTEGSLGDDDTRGAYINVRYRDSGSLTVADIDNDLDEFESQGHHINLVICDGDDLKPKGRTDSLYEMYLDIYASLANLAEHRDIAIWTAAQGTRDSFKRDVLEPHHVGDSMWKIRKADMALAMNMQPKSLDEFGRPIATFSVLKDRHYDTRRKVLSFWTDFGNKQTRGIPAFTFIEEQDEENNQTDKFDG